jgi:hypothetical protein
MKERRSKGKSVILLKHTEKQSKIELSDQDLFHTVKMSDLEVETITATQSAPVVSCTNSRRRWILAGSMLFSYVALQVTTSQLTNYVFVAEDIHFQAPCLFTFVKLSIRILLFPLYLGLSALINLIRRRPAGLRITIRLVRL